MRKIFIGFGFVVLLVGIVLFLTRTFYPDNVAETFPDGGTKGLTTREYKADGAEVADAVREVVPTLSSWGSNWKLAGSENEGETAIVKAEVPVVVFTDDLAVSITTDGLSSTVNVRSASRVGKSDFGENRRHVVQLLDELDIRFKGY